MLSHTLQIAVSLATLSAAAVLPGYQGPLPTATATHNHRRANQTASAQMATQPARLPQNLPGSPSPGFQPVSCHYIYCDEHQARWCYFWNGVTAWDHSLGPIPAETRVRVGTCSVEATPLAATATATATGTSHVHG